MPLIKKCRNCSKEFRTKPFFVKNGGGKYCSRVCQYRSYKTGETIKCFLCGIEAYRPRKKLKNSKSGKYFCSKSCQTRWRNTLFIGKKHANWIDGRQAYKSVLSRNKVPPICRICRTHDRRVLVVHHIDKNRKNNIISNLTWLCHNCHHLVHYHAHEAEKLKNYMVPIA